jgi:hypothetical protein
MGRPGYEGGCGFVLELFYRPTLAVSGVVTSSPYVTSLVIEWNLGTSLQTSDHTKSTRESCTGVESEVGLDGSSVLPCRPLQLEALLCVLFLLSLFLSSTLPCRGLLAHPRDSALLYGGTLICRLDHFTVCRFLTLLYCCSCLLYATIFGTCFLIFIKVYHESTCSFT